MFLRRIHIPLILQHLQRVDQPRAGFVRLDDGIEEAACGRDVGIGELLAVLSHQAGAGFLGVGGLGDLLAEDDVDRAVRPHHGDLGRSARPG